MIVMMISDAAEKERNGLMKIAKDRAAVYTYEYWQWLECRSVEDLTRHISQKTHVDLFCLDITMKDALDCLLKLREISPDAYLILVADPTISPLVYMKPTIRAESLLLKPLTFQHVRETMDEAISIFAKRFMNPDTTKVFVAESGGSRNLVEYNRIFYFEAREKKVFLNTGKEEIGFMDTLDHLEESLKENFIRVHRSFLVNKDKIRQVYISRGEILLDEDIEVPLSRSYKPAVREFLGGRNQNGSGSGQKLDPIL